MSFGSFIDYVAFCRAVEPELYGRKAPHSQQQEGEKKWKEKPFVRKVRGEVGPRPPQQSEDEEENDGYDRNGEGSFKV